MANSIEDALNHASAEQREKAFRVIEEARRNIKLVSVRDDITPTDADAISKNAQTIEEARRNIPFETMQDVTEVSPPLPTPSTRGQVNSNVIELEPYITETIERVEQGKGNNYLSENAVDRALNRQQQGIQREDEQRQAIGR